MNSEAVAVGKARPSSRCCPHWTYFLLFGVILTVSVAVSLVLLPHFLSEYDPLTGTDPLSCSPIPYTGSLCLGELRDWQSCLPERQNSSSSSSETLIPSTTDQELAESQAAMLFTGLQLVGASQDCEREFREFWCLLLFGVCDGSRQKRLPSFELCSSLQTDTCLDLYQFAATVPEFSVIIQNCNNFRFGRPPPCRNESGGVREEEREFNVSCSDGFFYDEASLVCKPRCGEWSPLSPTSHSAISILLILGNAASVLICTAVLVLSFIQYKQIFTFPSVLIIYSTVTVLLVALLDFVSFLPFNSLLCSSDDLLDSLTSGDLSTTFCKFQGGLFLYAALAISLFWLFQTAVYFWVVIYPIHYRSFLTSGKIQAIHLVSVATSLSLPAVPVVAIHFGKGFGLSLFVPNKCIMLDVNTFVYSFSVPLVVIVICGISLLVTTVWRVGNVRDRLQGKPFLRDAKLKAAELKLILIIIAYMCVALYTTLSANISLSHVGRHFRVLEEHFLCEGLGDSAMECSRAVLEELERDSFAQTFVYLTFNLYPSIFFIFLISPRMCSRVCHRKEDSSVPPVSSSTNSQA